MAYVGNVAFDANREQLKEVFEGCRVTFIRLHTDKDTGKSKGFAHVHFEDEESLDKYATSHYIILTISAKRNSCTEILPIAGYPLTIFFALKTLACDHEGTKSKC